MVFFRVKWFPNWRRQKKLPTSMEARKKAMYQTFLRNMYVCVHVYLNRFHGTDDALISLLYCPCVFHDANGFCSKSNIFTYKLQQRTEQNNCFKTCKLCSKCRQFGGGDYFNWRDSEIYLCLVMKTLFLLSPEEHYLFGLLFNYLSVYMHVQGCVHACMCTCI